MAAKPLASLLAVAKLLASQLAVASQPDVIPDVQQRRVSFIACSTRTAATAVSLLVVAKLLVSLLAVAKLLASQFAVAKLLTIAAILALALSADSKDCSRRCSRSITTTAASQHVVASQLAVAKLLASQLAVASQAADVATEPTPKRFVTDVNLIGPQP